MKFTLFYRTLASSNDGEAHFLRGICRELIRCGHAVSLWQAADGWSQEGDGAAVFAQSENRIAGVALNGYSPETLDLDRALDGADVVLVHESNAPELIAALGARRSAGGAFTLLFYDTRHRAVSAARENNPGDIEAYDGVLALGEVLRKVYLAQGWARQVFTWHQAADTALFRPVPGHRTVRDLVWISNWGGGSETALLREFLLAPVARLGLKTRILGAHYPDEVRVMLAAAGIDCVGEGSNHAVPVAFASALMTVDMPRGPAIEALPQIPDIGVFEALACGIPLVSALWRDPEGLFPPGCFLTVENGEEMTGALSLLRGDPALRAELIHNGLSAIDARHSCTHRVTELIDIIAKLGRAPMPRQAKAAPAETHSSAVP
jgi:spore maturation protein CgeB